MVHGLECAAHPASFGAGVAGGCPGRDGSL